MENRVLYPSAVIILLVALRLAIGWYFFESGRSKNLDRNFSSVGFLSQAKGPLAPLYKANLPHYHRFMELAAIPRVDAPNPHPARSAQWDAFHAAPYAAWQEQIVFDFGRLRLKANTFYQYDPDQLKRADKVFSYYLRQLDDYFITNRDDIAAYRHERARLHDWQQTATASDVPYQQQRIAAKQAELKITAAAFQTAVNVIEDELRDELAALAVTETAHQRVPLPRSHDTVARFDRFLMVTHFLIGGCLVVGFLSRFAAISAGLFLLTVIASQPPWIAGYSTIGYQVVMLIGCLLLAVTPSGRWCGIDYFLPTMGGGGSCKPTGPGPRTNS
jgi:uncharacterized membrane protein YphA (DoxX/SURF4 family)